MTGDVVDGWLNTPTISNISNGLQYWAAMAASGHPMAPMAKNFLSIPGTYQSTYSIIHFITRYTATSTDVECAFSRSGLTVSKMRHSLSDESTRAASVLGAWSDLAGAVPREEIMEIFKDKGRRPKQNNVSFLSSEMSDAVMS